MNTSIQTEYTDTPVGSSLRPCTPGRGRWFMARDQFAHAYIESGFFFLL